MLYLITSYLYYLYGKLQHHQYQKYMNMILLIYWNINETFKDLLFL